MIAIDPGYAKRGKGCACAHFRDGVLSQVWFARPERLNAPYDPCVSVSLVVWECPQVDARTRVSVPAVVQLAAVGGTLAGLYAGLYAACVESCTPSQWKGSTPKPVAHGRLWTLLSDSEREILGGRATLAAIDAAKRAGALYRWGKPGATYYPASFETHNILDAVGIGLWRLGRSKETRSC